MQGIHDDLRWAYVEAENVQILRFDGRVMFLLWGTEMGSLDEAKPDGKIGFVANMNMYETREERGGPMAKPSARANMFYKEMRRRAITVSPRVFYNTLKVTKKEVKDAEA